MRLRDDAFLNAPNEDSPRQHEALNREALRGIGDPMQRQVNDFVMSFGQGGVAEAPRSWSVGDAVEFTTPDGVKRVGSLCRTQADGDWLVQIDEGTYNIVPEARLRPTAATPKASKREDIQSILASSEPWTERHSPVQLSEHDFRITVDYGSLNKVPSDDEVCAYIQNKYASRVLDAYQAGPGKLEIVYTKQAAIPTPSDPTSTDQPGLETEEMEGTGKVSYVVESLKRMAALNTQYDIVSGSVVEDENTVTATFSLQAASGEKLFVNTRGNITPVMSADAAPAVGEISYDGKDLVGAIHGPNGKVALSAYLNVQAGVEPPHSSGDGPLGTRKDEPGSFESGDYIVKADAPGVGHYTRQQWEDEQARYYGQPTKAEEEAKKQRERARQHRQQMEQAPPQDWMTAATEEDGEVREEIAGPGEVVAVDQSAKDYYGDYYKGSQGYGQMLTRDIPRRKREKSSDMTDEIRAAWLVHQDREPTDHEMIRVLAVLYSKRTGMAAMQKEAQIVPMRDFINQLMEKSMADEDLQKQIDKMVAGYIATNPGEILGKLHKSIYPRTLYMMMQDPSKGYAKKLRKLHQVNVDPREHVTAPSAEEWGRGEQPAAPSDEGATAPAAPAGEQPAADDDIPEVKAPLMQRGKEFLQGLTPGGKVQRAIEKIEGPGEKKPGLWDKAKGLLPKDKVQRAVERIEQEELEQQKRQLEERAPLQVHPSRRQRVTPSMRGDPRAPLIVGGDPRRRGPGPSEMGAPPPLPHEPRASKEAAGNRQPAKGDMAAMKPRIEELSAHGSYLCLDIVWDPEDTEAMSSANVRQNIISWIKGQESVKEFIDLGTLGKPKFKEFDPDLGMARVLVRSSNAENMPQQVVEVDGKHDDASA